MPDSLIALFAKYGLLGLVTAWLLWQQHKNEDRLFKALNDATKALENFTVKLEQLWESR